MRRISGLASLFPPPSESIPQAFPDATVSVSLQTFLLDISRSLHIILLHFPEV